MRMSESEHGLVQIKDFVQHLVNGAPTIRGFEAEAAETFRIAAGKAA
jgi:hypothetical protein